MSFQNLNSINIIFGGDVMLGRLVKDEIKEQGRHYPMGKIATLMRSKDVTIVNLECAITTSKRLWSGHPKYFYFGAPPVAAKILSDCGVKIVSLANNHALDFNFLGLKHTLRYLKQEHILTAGAGKDITSANIPAIYQSKNVNFGMVAFCDHQEDFAATANRSGIVYLDLTNVNHVHAHLKKSYDLMHLQKVDWPILSLHWGPNQATRPSKQFMEIAHFAIELGYKTIYGHSAHNFLGIELYRGYPIIYSAGDLVDDYYVDPYYKNDHQLLFELQIEDLKLKKIVLYPVFIEYCQVKPANAQQFEWIKEKMLSMSGELGTVELNFSRF